MDTVYFDWAGTRLSILDNDNDEVRYLYSVDELLDSLDRPTRIISEATFESFDINKRAEVIDKARGKGHVWLTTPNRQTGRRRLNWVLNEPEMFPSEYFEVADLNKKNGDRKSDEIDVHVIRRLANENPSCLKSPNVRREDDRWVQVMDQIHDEMVNLRRTIRKIPSNRSAKGFVFKKDKDLYAKEIVQHLPKFKTLTDTQKKCFGSAGYSLCLVAAAAVATKHSRSRREFEHFTGLFGHGFPSQIRSDIHHHVMKAALKKGVTMSEFRRECRWLYHRLNELRDAL